VGRGPAGETGERETPELLSERVRVELDEAGVEATVARSGVLRDPQAVTELAEDPRARAAEGCLSVLDCSSSRRPKAINLAVSVSVSVADGPAEQGARRSDHHHLLRGGRVKV